MVQSLRLIVRCRPCHYVRVAVTASLPASRLRWSGCGVSIPSVDRRCVYRRRHCRPRSVNDQSLALSPIIRAAPGRRGLVNWRARIVCKSRDVRFPSFEYILVGSECIPSWLLASNRSASIVGPVETNTSSGGVSIPSWSSVGLNNVRKPRLSNLLGVSPSFPLLSSPTIPSYRGHRRCLRAAHPLCGYK